MAKTSTPYDLKIRAFRDDDSDPEHLTIEVNATHDPRTGKYSYADTLAGYRWCAGVLGRLGLVLAIDLAELRVNHGCTRTQTGHGCGPTLLEWTGPEIGEGGPVLTVDLPHHVDQKEWVNRVTELLNSIIAADQWQPTSEEEAEWSAG